MYVPTLFVNIMRFRHFCDRTRRVWWRARGENCLLVRWGEGKIRVLKHVSFSLYVYRTRLPIIINNIQISTDATNDTHCWNSPLATPPASLPPLIGLPNVSIERTVIAIIDGKSMVLAAAVVSTPTPVSGDERFDTSTTHSNDLRPPQL